MSKPAALVSVVSGSLTEVSAIRGQDAMLSCNSEASLWAQAYARITNFAMGEVDIAFTGAPAQTDWSATQGLQAEFQRAGDLVTEAYVQFFLSALPVPAAESGSQTSSAALTNVFLWTPAVGYALIQNIQLTIGQQQFDQFGREFIMNRAEVHQGVDQKPGMAVGDYGMYLRGCAKTNSVQPIAAVGGSVCPDFQDELTISKGLTFSTRGQNIIAPIPFHFTHPGQHINLIGLQQHQVQVKMDIESKDNLIIVGQLNRATGAFNRNLTPFSTLGTPSNPTAYGNMKGLSLRCVYVYLDTAERRVRAQQPEVKMFVSQQIQAVSISASAFGTAGTAGSTDFQFQNYFNHPIIDFLISFRTRESLRQKEYFNFGVYRAGKTIIDAWGQLSDPVLGNATDYYSVQEVVSAYNRISLQVNNYTRFDVAEEYARLILPHKRGMTTPNRIVHTYAFSHHSTQESGTKGSFNLSAIDNVVFSLGFKGVSAAASTLADNQELICQSVSNNGSVGSAGNSSVGVLADCSGTLFIQSRMFNFYKQSAGMMGVLFAN
jgi:hypothetical protein